MTGVDAGGFCWHCGKQIADPVWDHEDECPTGQDNRKLFAHEELVWGMKEFSAFMGPCPTHGKPDLPNAFTQLHRWKELLLEGAALCSEGLHREVMRPDWSDACKAHIKEVETIECNTKNPS